MRFLEVVLKVGNMINTGSFRGGAYGFKLDTLNKVESTTQAFNPPCERHVLNFAPNIISSLMCEPRARRSPRSFTTLPPRLRRTGLSSTIWRRISWLCLMLAEVPSLPAGPVMYRVRLASCGLICATESLSQVVSDLAGIKKSVEFVGNQVKNPPAVPDKFFNVMSEFYNKASQLVSTLETKLKKTEEAFAKTAEYYGEQANTPAEQLFNTVWSAVQGLERAKVRIPPTTLASPRLTPHASATPTGRHRKAKADRGQGQGGRGEEAEAPGEDPADRQARWWSGSCCRTRPVRFDSPRRGDDASSIILLLLLLLCSHVDGVMACRNVMDNLIGQMHTGDAFAARRAAARPPGQAGPPGGQQMVANEAMAIFARMKQKREGN